MPRSSTSMNPNMALDTLLVTPCFSFSIPASAKEARLAWDVAKSQEGWYLAIDEVKITGMSGGYFALYFHAFASA
jgi:hypothetical protein